MSEIIYSREELKLLVQPFIKTNSKGRTDILEKRISQELKEQIILSTEGCRDDRFSERVFWILKDIYEYPICIECGHQFQPRYYGLNTHWSTIRFCSKKCLCNNKEVKDKTKQTNFERTGYYSPLSNPEVREKGLETLNQKYGTNVVNVFQIPEIKEQIKQTNYDRTGYYYSGQNPEVRKKMSETYFEKTGYTNPWENPEVQEKMKQKYFEKTGYYNPLSNPEIRNKNSQIYFQRTGYYYPSQNPEVQEKMSEIYFKKTGYYYPNQNPEVQEKIKKTLMLNKGVENVFQLEEVKQKIKETNLKKYGVEHALQCPDFFNKSITNSKKTKWMTLPSGKQISYQRI